MGLKTLKTGHICGLAGLKIRKRRFQENINIYERILDSISSPGTITSMGRHGLSSINRGPYVN